MPSVPYVTHACFGLSYACAFALEAAGLRWPRRGIRTAGVAFGALGMVLHSAFLAQYHPTPATPDGALLAVAWVLGVFYLYGTLHYARQAWAVFTLPVVAGLVGLSFVQAGAADAPAWLAAGHFWGAAHGLLVLAAAVGLAVGFLASVMYLVQARRLRDKSGPVGGVKLLSLERLEAMSRRGVNAAFPLLTLGLVLGAVLMPGHDVADGFASVKVLGTVGLWAVCGVLFYLRYAAHVPGRRLARLSILAFALVVLVLAAAHPFARTAGGAP